jgi:membrane protein DedA with SNARE-associated domain
MASLGSALGSIPLYVIGYLGGEKVLRKRISDERFLKIHRSFEQHEFWALMFPGNAAAAHALQNLRAGCGGL